MRTGSTADRSRVSIFLFGGLGNRLFQMASCLGIARKRGAEYGIAGYDPSGARNRSGYVGLMKRFCPDQKLRAMSSADMYRQTTTGGIGFVERTPFQLDPDVLRPDSATTLLGYFQAEKYFRDYRQEILLLFQASEFTLDSIDKTQYPFGDAFFLHFRFRDFLGKNKSQHFFDLTNYYRQCLSEIPKDVPVLIFSDEPDQIDQLYPGLCPNGIIVRNDNDLTSLHMMAKCALGGICANSTFSWWSAYLNTSPHKRIYMPDRLVKSIDTTPDFYPEDAQIRPIARTRAFVINLDQRPDRWRAVQTQLKDLKADIDISRLAAVHLADRPLLGCTRSHKKVVRTAKENCWPLVIAIEDDVVIKDQSAVIDLVRFLHTRNDWNICFGGVSACHPVAWSHMTGRAPSVPTIYKNINAHITEVSISLSAAFVIYHHNVYDAVLSLDEDNPDEYIDVYLSERIQRKWVRVPFLIYQAPGYSDILNCDVNTRSAYDHSERYLISLKQLPQRRSRGNADSDSGSGNPSRN